MLSLPQRGGVHAKIVLCTVSNILCRVFIRWTWPWRRLSSSMTECCWWRMTCESTTCSSTSLSVTPTCHSSNSRSCRNWCLALLTTLVRGRWTRDLCAVLVLSAPSNHIIAVFLLNRYTLPSVLWHCWLGARKGIQAVQNWVVRCWHRYLSRARCRFAYGPTDATATHLSLASVKSRLVLSFWYWCTRVIPDKGPLNRCCCLLLLKNECFWPSSLNISGSLDCGIKHLINIQNAKEHLFLLLLLSLLVHIIGLIFRSWVRSAKG